MLPDWMRGIVRVTRTGARTGDIVYLKETDSEIAITPERRYRIWEEQAREIGRELEREMGSDRLDALIDDLEFGEKFKEAFLDDLPQRVAEEADNHVPYGTYERWSLYTEGLLWQMEEFEDALQTAMNDPFDEGRLPAYLLYFKAEELIYGQMGN